MRYYFDEHVPPSITSGLRRLGVDVLTVQEDGYRGKADPLLFDRAVELGRLVYFQDDDFLRESKRRQVGTLPFPGVVYCHQLRLSIGRQVQQLETIAKYGDPEEFANRVTYLPIR
jgi:predicted nuclease of predicted toxin-antitoxin system